MKYKSQFIIAVCVAAVALAPASSRAAEQKKTAAASPSPTAKASSAAPPAKSARSMPFHGMVSAVDHNAKTFTIAGKKAARVFKVTKRTVIMKGTSTGTLDDIVAHEEVRGSYWKADDGSLEAKKVTIGKAEGAEKKTKKSKTETSPDSTEASPKP